ncbi:MFS transporter [Amycolatopsis sp. cmx-11-12]|uniref:MFS transporter n=1 Tax=Amycolatopsis sp. cmx-11-12 TaxID=2785795 RepID=UPI003917CDB2
MSTTSEGVQPRRQSLLAGASPWPLIVLSLVYFVDELDNHAFNVLSSSIQSHFRLTTQEFTSLSMSGMFLAFALLIPVARLADRARRTSIVVVSALLVAGCALLVGFAGSALVLAVARLGKGIGVAGNNTAHKSLLTDYYPPAARPLAIGVHTGVVQVITGAGPLIAGVLGRLLSWRQVFIIIFIPMAVMVVIAAFLREPRRGATDLAGPVQNDSDGRPTIRSAVRQLWEIRTLRRIGLAVFVFGPVFLGLAPILPLFLSGTYHLDPLEMGIVLAIGGLANVAGLLWSARRCTRWAEQESGKPLQRAGIAMIVAAPPLAVIALVPSIIGATLALAATQFILGVTIAPYMAVVAQLAPARIRSFTFAAIILPAVLGGLLLYQLPQLPSLADTVGYKWMFPALCPYLIVAGLIMRSASRFVASDYVRTESPREGDMR